MIKSFCDICEQNADSKEFFFQAEIVEMVGSLIDKNPVKQPVKRQINLCQDCYKQHLKPLLYDSKKK